MSRLLPMYIFSLHFSQFKPLNKKKYTIDIEHCLSLCCSGVKRIPRGGILDKNRFLCDIKEHAMETLFKSNKSSIKELYRIK